MPRRTFVVGHKNPDTDSIVSAVIRETLLAKMTSFRGERGYASLLLMVVDIVHSQLEILVVGMEDVVATAPSSLLPPRTRSWLVA
jgi:inorganic pyrophosphatase/exopolyphosphatase